jgi:acyl-CoA dehydrogenase
MFEEAGYSIFIPVAVNINPPDEGRVHALAQAVSARQRDGFLTPHAAGEVRGRHSL